MELARAWFVSTEPRCPPEITGLLSSQSRTNGLVFGLGLPEKITTLPEHNGGTNHDLLLFADGPNGPAIVSIEAKVDEPFKESIGKYWDRMRQSTTRSGVPKRIEALLSLIFGSQARPDAEPWRELRYQLLTAVAGTAIEAASRPAGTAAVLVVHEFRTEKIDPKKIAANGEDFQRFVGAILLQPAGTVVPGQLYGPVILPESTHLARKVDLFIGKAVFEWQPKSVSAQPADTAVVGSSSMS